MLSTDVQPVTEGTLQCSDGRVLPLEWTRMRARVRGALTSVEVRQGFHNPTSDTLEAIYLFPLPHTASVFRLEFRIGERVVKATVREREEARRVYLKAWAGGRASTLLEQEKPNLFTLSVANIGPGERVEVCLEYQESVAFDEGEWRLVMPLVASERYDATPTEGKIRPPRARSQERVNPISIEVELDTAGPYSASHPIEVEDGCRVRLRSGEVVPNRDFVLSWRLPGQGVRPLMWFEREAGRPGTFSLCIPAPPLGVSLVRAATRPGCCNCGAPVEQAPRVREVPELGRAWPCDYCGAFQLVQPPTAERPTGKDVVFLVDRSASVQNLEAARAVVNRIVGQLREEDAFRVIAFHHELQRMSEEWLPGGTSAERFLSSLDCRGGTELEEALRVAGSEGERPNRVRVIVLLSDGAIGNGAPLLRILPSLLRGARLFVLGTGAAVNHFLLDKLARVGRGAWDVGTQPQVLERFSRRVYEATPMLTQISVAWLDGPALEVYPTDTTELFSGQALQLIGRFVGNGPNRLVLAGKTASGRAYRQELEVDLPEESVSLGLERAWARHRIEALQDELTRRPERLGDIRLETLGLALKHQLMSPYSALVAEDSEVSVDPEAPQQQVQVELAEPALVTREASSKRPESVVQLMHVDPLSVEIGRGLLALLDPLVGARLLGAVPAVRSQLAAELGIEFPGLRFLDNLSLESNAYVIKIKDVEVGRGTVMPDRLLVLGPKEKLMSLTGVSVEEPAYGLSAVWINRDQRGEAERLECCLFDSVQVLLSHLSEVVRGNAADLLGRRETQALLDAVKKIRPDLVADFKLSLGEFQQILQNLLKARVSIVDLVTILETLWTHLGTTKNLDRLTEFVRAVLPDPPSAVYVRPPVPVAVVSQVEPCQIVPEVVEYSPDELRRARAMVRGHLDLVFLVDETGSMGPYIHEVKVHLLSLVEALRKSALCRKLRLGLVTFRDHPPQERTFVTRVAPLTENISEIQASVNRMQAQGGGDGPEAVTDGLHDLLCLNWDMQAARLVVMVGDAPPHGVEPRGDGFPEGCPCGRHWYVQAESCREMGIVIHTLGCRGLYNFVHAGEVFRTLARATGGLHFHLGDAGLLISLVTDLAERQLDRERLEKHVEQVVAAHRELLEAAELSEQIRFLTQTLQAQGLRVLDVGEGHRLAFRGVQEGDVRQCLDSLRRRSSLVVGLFSA